MKPDTVFHNNSLDYHFPNWFYSLFWNDFLKYFIHEWFSEMSVFNNGYYI